MTEAVSLGELLHEEALLVLPGGSTPRTLIPVWTLPLRHISSSLSVARPFTNGVEWGWKKCIDPMVGGARSITLYDACTPSSGLPATHLKLIERARSNRGNMVCMFVELAVLETVSKPQFSYTFYSQAIIAKFSKHPEE